MTHSHSRPYGPKRHREGQPDLRGLDEVHRRLVTAVCAGEWAEFEDTEVLDTEVLVALVTGQSYKGRPPWPVTDKGILIEGGRVESRLDLSQAQIEWRLELIGTDLPEGIGLIQANTRRLVFDHCKLKDIHMPGAHVKGQFGANHVEFDAAGNKALWAPGAEISDDMFLENATLNGQCDISGTKIGGQFNAMYTSFNTPNDIAIRAQGAQIRADVFLNNANINGQCSIAGAIIDGQFSVINATLNNPSGCAFNAQGAEIAGGVFLDNATLNGRCDINSTKFSRVFSANNVELNNPDKDALQAQDAEISGSVFLINVSIKGICNFNSAQTSEIFLIGANILGEFRGDQGARIKRLDLSSAKLVSARHTQVEAVPAETADPKGEPKPAADPFVLDLTDARIGRLDMPQSPQHQIKGVVKLTRCHVEHFCDRKNAWPDPLERLDNTWVTPPSRRDPETGDDIGYFDLNGFTYDYLAAPNGGDADGAEENTAETRKRWLLSQRAHDIADHFKPQPWRQMAARLEAQGHDDAARRIALFRRQIHRQSKAVTGWRVVISWLLDKLSHYGFNPWLTLAWSVGVIALWALAYGGFAATGPMPGGGYQPLPMIAPDLIGPASDANANPPPVFIRAQADDVTAATNINDLAQADPFLSRVYPDFNPLLYSLDVFVPVLDLGMEAYWRPNPNHLRPGLGGSAWMVGSILYWLTIVQRFVGAILIAIMVTSFTGLLTREDKLS